MTFWFIGRCVYRRAPVDCFWFPATVSLATPALTAPKLHTPEWVLHTALLAGAEARSE